MQHKVLVVDDDTRLQHLLQTYLKGYDLEVVSSLDGNQVGDLIRREAPDIVILDIILPGNNGLDILREIREISTVPVIMLSAKGEDADRIVGLELGADDYMPKPCNPRELLARIKAVLRRSATAQQSTASKRFLRGGELTLDRSRQYLSHEGHELPLSSMEFLILEALMLKPGTVLSRDELMHHARGQDTVAFDRSIDMHISNLRSKIEGISGRRDCIKTVWGSGYMYVVNL